MVSTSPPFEISRENINNLNCYFNRLVVRKTVEYICQVQTVIGFNSVVNQMVTVPNGAAHQDLIRFNQPTN